MRSDASASSDEHPGRRVEELERELQSTSQELVEARELQAATTDILAAISSSPTDPRGVFAEIAASAARLCDAYDAVILQLEQDGLRTVGHFGPIPPPEFLPLANDTVMARAVTERRSIQVANLQTEDIEYPTGRVYALRFDFRTQLTIPLLRNNDPIGVIAIRRREVRPFTDRQIDLLKTFASQAVIAIENTRLFEEVQSRTRELQESLNYQSATSEVLSVIARAPSDLQQVLDAVAESAARACIATEVRVFRLEGDKLRRATRVGRPDVLGISPDLPLGRGSVSGRAIVDRRTIHVEDLAGEIESEFPDVAAMQKALGHRTTLATPLLRDGDALGAILVLRTEVAPFSDKQIRLLETLADQAVIAIENARLFEAEQASKRDLQESLQQQTATADVLKVISRSTFDLPAVLNALANSSARLCEADAAQMLRPTGEQDRYYCAASYGHPPEFNEYVTTLTFPPGRGSVTGRILLEGRPVHILDVLADAEYSLGQSQSLGGFRTHFGVPLLREGAPIGVILLSRSAVRPFTDKQMELATTFADQAVIAIENVRLFEEIAQKSRELEIASQHKSQFVANMSHELRTPLAAILGYAELMQEGFYEPLGQKSMDALARIRSNGKHLLGLINTVLDVAKIESGQFSLNLTEYALETIVETVRAATESLAESKKLALATDLAKSLPVGFGDDQRLTQVLLNLVGNAIKFTDAGEVRIIANATNGHLTVAVTDTGPGIPADQLTQVFEQFHQVDSSNTKAKGGTGLGLAISKQIVEMHGGRIWVESTLGQGSTFRIELPVRAATGGAR
ncbi:MAG: GAF domain-containing protein [Hyphomicrobiaceae bacterium]